MRPASLEAVVGQVNVKEALKIMMVSADKRGKALDHLLFSGPPGLGKTTLSRAIASDLGREVFSFTGPSFDRNTLDFFVHRRLGHPVQPEWVRLMEESGAPVANSTTAMPILFIDEVHALPLEVFELMFPLMEDFWYDGHTVGSFTLIGATTNPGKLPEPLRDRFGATFELSYYEAPDLEVIAKGVFADEDIAYDDGVTAMIAGRSRGTPRLAIRMAKRVVDVAMASDDEVTERILVRDVVKASRLLDIDGWGLDATDRKILRTMVEKLNRPAGAGVIAALGGINVETFETVHEPWLNRAGYIERTPRGRVATPTAIKVVGEMMGGCDLYD